MHAPPLVAVLLLAAAGCGDISTVSPDATPLDASTDAAELGTVSLELLNPFDSDRVPLPGSTMLVLMQDGTVIGDDVTDDDGLASVDGVPQGAIMLVFPELAAGVDGAVTIAVYDVGPGDDIHFGREDAQGEMLGNMNVLLPAYKDAAPTYHVANGCQENSNPDNPTNVPLSFYESCVIDGDTDLLAWVVGQSGQIVAYLDANRPFDDGVPVDLSALTWQTPEMFDVTLTDLPAEVRRVSFRVDPMLGHREFGPVFELNDIDTPDPTMELGSPVPASFGDSTRVNLGFEPDQDSLGSQMISHRATDDVEWALDDELLPWYSSAVYSTADRRITWSRTSGRDPDVHYILLQWLEQEAGTENAWYTVSPADREELVLPPLPAEWEDHLPDQLAAITELQFYAAESSVVDGYAAARLVGFDLVGEDPINQAPAGATMRLSLGAGTSN